jgi:hypothetical chaperone protein
MTPAQVSALYFTGDPSVSESFAAASHEAFPASRMVVGDHFASVARGLGVSALR